LNLCRDWVSPGEPVTWTPLRPGDQAELASGHAVRALTANHWQGVESVGPALLYVLNDRVLVGWDTAAPLPTACREARYDLVLLDCNDGDRPSSAHHHTLADFAATIDDLRAHDAIHPATRIVGVSLGHANPPGPELDRRLAGSSAEPGRDGLVIHLE
jgi:hypothetical protein